MGNNTFLVKIAYILFGENLSQHFVSGEKYHLFARFAN